MQTKYYSVRVDGQSWTKDAVDASEFTNRGYTIQPSRRIGDASLFSDGRLVAHLFASKASAAAFVSAA
jgi:hypothetical protein